MRFPLKANFLMATIIEFKIEELSNGTASLGPKSNPIKKC